MKKYGIPTYIQTIFKVYGILILFFTLFRLFLVASEWGINPALNDLDSYLYVKAFWMGWRFDTAICAYLLTLPLLLLFLSEVFRKKVFSRLAFGFIYFFGIISLLIHSADIPYFSQFYARFNTAAFAWVDSTSFVIDMIITESKYWLYIFLFIVLSYFFIRLIKKTRIAFQNQVLLPKVKSGSNLKYLLLPLMLFMLLVGMRGRFAQKSPIRVGTAFFSNNSFINQLGLNPVFTLLKSVEHDLKPMNNKIHYMEDEKALLLAKSKLTGAGTIANHPIARLQDSKSIQQKTNVVLVLMESFSAEKMGLFGNEKNMTPHLDAIANEGWSFNNFYSAGIHTYNGIYSSLFGHPALLKQHAMKKVQIPKMYGFPQVLKQHDYYTAYFTTHDDQFDNVGGFLYENKFDIIYSEKDYPSEEVVSTLGVPDHYLYEFGLDKLDGFYQKGKPFFATFMTGSDHPPYTIPENIDFSSDKVEIMDRVVEYVDWSINKFIDSAKTKDWFDETVFVFVADHGVRVNDPYLMPLSYHHIPCIIYQPSRIKEGKVFEGLGGQIDLLPTIAEYIGVDFENYTLGVNLLKEERPYMYFSADSKYGVVNDSLYLIVHEGKESLYNYRERSTVSIAKNHTEIVREMKDYYASMTQVSQILLDKGSCSPE